jgi:CheY-like chemotaxis protein
MDTVLIVDDSAFIVEGLIAFLKKKYLPVAAHGGAECLEILQRQTPSVIILDIMMEPMDGWETLAHIRENPDTRHIPVLMFSAIKISPEEAEEHQISLDDCLTKPVSPNKIIEAIEKVISRRDTHRMVVERWQSAGIGQEKIDEYLSLVNRLEGDLSLCQNMKVQYDLVPPNDTNHEEFHAAIRAVEERILQERDQIETLAREMNEVLDHRPGIRDPAAPLLPSPGPEEPVPLQSSQVVFGDESALRPGSSATLAEVQVSREPETPPSTPEPEKPIPVQTSQVVSGDESALKPGSSVTLPDMPVPQGPETPRAIPEPDVLMVQDPKAVLDAGPVPAAPDEIPGLEPSVPGEPGIDETGEPVTPLPVTGPADQKEAGGPEQVTVPGTPVPVPVLAVQEPPVVSERKVIPASMDLPPDAAGISSKNGAGTDVPMPWDTGRDRKSRTAVPGPVKKDASEKPDTPQPAPGFLARVLSLVTSLFGRRT